MLFCNGDKQASSAGFVKAKAMKRSVLVIIILVTALALYADTVKLRDGSTVEGRITKRTDAGVTINVEGMPIDIEMDQIASINGEPVAHAEQPKEPAPEERPAQPKSKAAPGKTAPREFSFPPKPDDAQITANARAKSRVKPDRDKVLHISDQEFFDALDLTRPDMKAVAAAVRRKRYDAAWKAWDDFMRKDFKPVGDLRDVERYRAAVAKPDPARPCPTADDIVNHKIRVWHRQVVDFGPDMDWTNVKGRSSLYGFHYWGWSSRLWTAYFRTGNDKYAAGFDDLFTSWYAQRENVNAKYGGNVIWYELGAGCRPIPILRLYYAMLPSKALRPETRKLVMKTILGHARFLHAEQQCGYTNGNFQLTASQTLYQLGLLFPQFKDADAWRETGAARLLEHAMWDFSKEGGHSERCVGYGSISMHAVRRLLLYAEDDPNPSSLLPMIRDRVLQMQLWFLKYVAPNGDFPGVNDSSFTHGDALLVDLAKFAKDGRFLWPVRDSRRLPDDIEPKEPDFLSVHMPDSGWTFMRDGWDRESFYLQVNWGKYGGGHTHPGILDINVYAYGAPMTIETGRFGSYDNPLEPYFRSPEAHNQVFIVNATMDRRNCFGEEVLWRSGRHIDYFEGIHRGYEQSAGKVLKRQILFVKGRHWLVVDTVLDSERNGGSNEKAVAGICWHAPHPWKERDGGFVAGKEGGPGVQLIMLEEAGPGRLGKPTFGVGYKDTVEYYKSRYWVRREQPATNGALFVTVIAPYREKPDSWKMEPVRAGRGTLAVQITSPKGCDRIVVATGKKKMVTAGELTTNARAAWTHQKSGPSARVRKAAMVDGSLLIFRKTPVFREKVERELAESE